MHKLKNKLTSLLTLNRGTTNHTDSKVGNHSSTHAQIDAKDKVGATHLESQPAANDKDDRPDWYQSIHDSSYYNE